MDRVIQMLLRMVINKVMRTGISKGIDMATKGREDKDKPPMNPEQQKQMRDRANLMRRFRRF